MLKFKVEIKYSVDVQKVGIEMVRDRAQEKD